MNTNFYSMKIKGGYFGSFLFIDEYFPNFCFKNYNYSIYQKNYKGNAYTSLRLKI